MDESQATGNPDLQNESPVPRLTLRFFLRDLAERFFNLERGWLRTARELSTAPGPMIRRYLGPERRSYANPVAYLLVCMAVNIVVQKALGFQETMAEHMPSNAANSPGQLAFARDIQNLLMEHLLYVTLGLLIPFAVLLRGLFRRAGYNLAEMAVFALYTGGHLALLGVITVPLVTILSVHPLVIGGPVGFAYFAWAGIGFFGGRVLTALKIWFAYISGFVLYMIVSMVVAIIYTVFFMSSAYTSLDEWNLVTAAEEGQVAVVASLLDDGADIDLVQGRTALHAAAENGSDEIVELLLERGADVDALDHLGRSPIFYAVRTDHREIASRLLEAGADPTLRSDDGETLLIMVAKDDETSFARRLLDSGCEVNAIRTRDGHEVTALIRAAHGGNADMVRLLLERGADPELGEYRGKTAVDLADTAKIESLIEAALAAQRESAAAAGTTGAEEPPRGDSGNVSSTADEPVHRP